MERRVNFTLIGIIFFSILSALVVFIIVMGKFNFHKNTTTDYIVYTQEEITGIGINTPVRYKGINIGNVSYIGFDKEKIGVVKIIVKIKKDIPIRKNSTLVMDSQGLAGLNFLALKQSNNNEFITNESDAILRFEPNLLGKLSSKADEASKELIDILKNAKTLLSEKNTENVSQIIDSIQTLSKNLNQTQDNIDEFAKNFNLLVNNLNKQIENGDYNIREILNPLVLRLNSSLNYVDQFFKHGTSILDKFEKDPYNTLFGEQKK